MRNRLRQFAAAFAILLVSGVAVGLMSAGMARADILSAPEAQAAVESGEMVLLDIRTPKEWKQSGVARGAWPVDLQGRDFAKVLQQVLSNNPGRKLGLICATGGRSAYVAGILRKNGLRNVVDVGEGMFGSRHGPGWTKRGMPVVPANRAISAMPGDYRASLPAN